MSYILLLIKKSETSHEAHVIKGHLYVILLICINLVIMIMLLIIKKDLLCSILPFDKGSTTVYVLFPRSLIAPQNKI
jgi:hypothetical protein